jgi:sugar lactone lactonase YvrE
MKVRAALAFLASMWGCAGSSSPTGDSTALLYSLSRSSGILSVYGIHPTTGRLRAISQAASLRGGKLGAHPSGRFVFVVGHEDASWGITASSHRVGPSGLPTRLSAVFLEGFGEPVNPSSPVSTSDRLYVAVRGASTGVVDTHVGHSVMDVDPATGEISSARRLTVPGLRIYEPFGLALSKDASHLYLSALVALPAAGEVRPFLVTLRREGGGGHTESARLEIGGPEGPADNLAIDPGGAFLYMSSLEELHTLALDTPAVPRELSSVVVDETESAVRFRVHPSGRFIAVWDDHRLELLRVDRSTGEVTLVQEHPLPAPATLSASHTLAWDPSGRFLYASSTAGLVLLEVDIERALITEIARLPDVAEGELAALPVPEP